MSLFKKSLALAAALSVLSLSASGQAQYKVAAEDPKFEDLPSPQLGGNTGQKNFKPKEWLEAEVKLKVEARPKPEDDYLDGLQIKWYVAVKNPSGKGFFLLEKTVEYQNIPHDEEVFAAVYLSPAAIQRLTGSDRAGASSVEGIAGEVSISGQKVAVFNSRSEDEWWTSPSLARTQKFPLMSKSETPFANLWYDRYLEEQQDN